MNSKYDDGLTLEQRWMIAVAGCITAILFPIFDILYYLILKAVTSPDERTLALSQLFVPLPISIFVSYKIYVLKLQPIVAKIIDVRQKRLLEQKRRK